MQKSSYTFKSYTKKEFQQVQLPAPLHEKSCLPNFPSVQLLKGERIQSHLVYLWEGDKIQFGSLADSEQFPVDHSLPAGFWDS